MKFLILLMILFLTGHSRSDDPLILMKKGFDEFIQTQKKPQYLQNAIDSIFNTTDTPAKNKASCDFCIIVANTVLNLRRNGASRETIWTFGTHVSSWLGAKKAFWTGYLDMQMDTALYIIDNNPKLTAERICAIKYQEYNCVDLDIRHWSVNIPPRIESINDHKLSMSMNNSTNDEYVLHLTDIHLDPLYEPGANTKCDFLVCCQSTNGKANDPEQGAGYWGDYSASDTPLHSVLDVLQQVVKQHPKIDRVYFTGDIVSHKIWASSKEESTSSIKKIMAELRNTFKSIPVFPILGNHESHPSDFFSPKNLTDSKISTQWLLDLVAEEWSYWLPNDTQHTIKTGGYYSVLVKPGLRVIGLNTNVCFTFNLWLIHDNNDLQEQLQWLVDVLADAEKNGEYVHIVSHVPTGDKQCLRQWSHEYRRIVDRFSKIITGQFHGHTHDDELKIFYGIEKPDEVVNVAFIGGSVTTFIGLNPNYRVYSVDSGTWRVNNYEQWMFNLKEANKYPDQAPKWFKLYSFKEAYGLKHLDLSTYDELLKKMASNTSLIEQYRRFKVRESEVLLRLPCEKECISDLYCSITNIESEDSIQCESFKTKM